MTTAEASIDPSWVAFRVALETAIGVPLHHYKEPQMKRRLGSMMARKGHLDWEAFRAAILADTALLTEVRDMLTINVSEFFRQPERFAELEQTILPAMLRERRSLRLWSAGCSIGCEPYSLAMLLTELDPSGHSAVLATDIDMPALARARQGSGYGPGEIRTMPEVYREKYLCREPGGTFAVTDDVKRRVKFRHHDLLSERYPAAIDLILCRNVVIYFTEGAKAEIYANFARALRPGGYLFVGGSEMIMRSRELGLRTAGTSFYRLAS